MSRNRSLTRAAEEFVEAVRGIEDAHRCHPNCGSTAVMVLRNPRGIGGLVKLPEGLDTWMYTLRASEHLAPDAHMSDVPIGDDRARDGERPVGVGRGFADPPPVLRIPHVP